MRRSFNREFYIPEHATKVAAKDSSAVAYIADEYGRFYATAFFGKANKPSLHASYRTAEARAKALAAWFDGMAKASAYKSERQAARKAFRHTLKVGDVLRSSWGYDQTNIDYYEVVSVNGAMIEARPIAVESVETGFLQGKCVPVPGHYTGPAKRYRPTEGNAVKVRSFAWAHPAEYQEVAGAKVYGTSHWTAYA